MVYETGRFYLNAYGVLKIRVGSLLERNSRKQVVNQWIEQKLIFVDLEKYNKSSWKKIDIETKDGLIYKTIEIIKL